MSNSLAEDYLNGSHYKIFKFLCGGMDIHLKCQMDMQDYGGFFLLESFPHFEIQGVMELQQYPLYMNTAMQGPSISSFFYTYRAIFLDVHLIW